MDTYSDDMSFTSQPATNSAQDSRYMMGDMSETAGIPFEEAKNDSLTGMDIQEQQSSSKIDDINRKAQELVEKINEARSSDQKLMDAFHEQLQETASMVCQQMKMVMFKVYEENGENLQVKLLELTEVLENCTKLDQELQEATKALACLRDGFSIPQTSSP